MLTRTIAIVTLLLAALAALAASACRSVAESPAQTQTPAPPPAATKWLCRPGLPDDPCRATDLSLTEIRSDGTRAVVPFHLAEHPKVDCFYVYPTVDLDLVPGNHENLEDVTKQTHTTLAQAARLGETCAVWAPLYHQATIGSYLQGAEEREKKLAIAFQDIDRAFREFLAQSNPAHKIVLIGHSQGGDMIIRVIKRFFDDDPALRARLLLALPIGANVDVASGTSFGTSKSIPPCTQPMQVGCLVAYRTYAGGEDVELGYWAPPPGHESVCVDPSALDRAPGSPEPHLLAGSIFPASRGIPRLRGIENLTTPFVSFPSYYEAHCARGREGFTYLEVNEPRSDPRPSPLDLRGRELRFGKLGLHILDLQLPQRDIVDLVARRAAVL